MRLLRYSTKCTCGHRITVVAQDREDAIVKIKEIRSVGAIAAHMLDKHKGDPVPSKEQSDANIEKMIYQEGRSAAV